MTANSQDFSRMKNDELGSFLRDRGIPCHDRKKKDRITLAKAANNLGFLVRPKPDEIKAEVPFRKDSYMYLS